MNCDIIFIAVLAKLMQKLIGKTGFGDYLVTLFVMALLYCIPKGLILGYFWGFTFPMNTQRWPQFISGAISFAGWLTLILCRQYQLKHETK